MSAQGNPLLLTALLALACTNTTAPLQTPAPPSVRVDGTRFVDRDGRTLMLRGINVGGAAKLPNHVTNTTQPGVLDTQVSYIDRPLPLTEAAAHFRRTRSWGMRLLRLNITWDAVAHAGPGTVDVAYLDYLRALIVAAGEQGLAVVVDMHQDVWSRWTGGDGAPAWTLTTAGFELDRLDATGAAYTHAAHPQELEHLQWPTNHSKLAAATMFTLFWAGDDFAPELQVDGVSIQQFLQDEYIAAWQAVAAAVADLPAVVGYDLMNEPGVGFIGLNSLAAWDTRLQMGPMPTPAQALFAAEFPQVVTTYVFAGLGFAAQGTTTINPDGLRVWRDDASDPWRVAGVWDVVDGRPRLLRDDYFAMRGTGGVSVPVDLVADYIQPFYARLAVALQAVDADAVVFLETPAEDNAAIAWPDSIGVDAVFAPHWYDALTLLTRSFSPEFNVRIEPEVELVGGRDNVATLFREQLAALQARANVVGLPMWVGEFGLPFDPSDAADGFAAAADGLGMYHDAMDALGLSAAVWNYAPANTPALGDGWNLENLSMVTPTFPEGRARTGYARPYVMAAAGRVVRHDYDVQTRRLDAVIEVDSTIAAPSVVVVPTSVYPEGVDVAVSGGRATTTVEGTIEVFADAARVELRVFPRAP